MQDKSNSSCTCTVAGDWCMHKVEQIEHRGGKRALRCSRPKGHESFHIACCLAPNFEEHMMAVWDDNGNDIKGLLA